MKILVNNEKEQDLVRRFLKSMRELDMISELLDRDQDCKTEFLNSDESHFFDDMLLNACVEIDPSVAELFAEHHILTGTCAVCGQETEGTIDGNDISYSDYLDSQSLEIQGDWRCESCWGK